MSDDSNELPCQFRWGIRNPFVPWRSLKATFFFETPTLTRWEVTFKPTNRIQLKHVLFSFSMTCSGIDEEHTIPDVISVRKLEVHITRETALIIEKRELAYDFKQANEYTYEFETEFYHDPKYELDFLALAVKFNFCQRRCLRIVRTGSEFNADDLTQLSEDFGQLFSSSLYSNLKLKSTKSNDILQAHSYILRARWNNFFAEPSHRTINGTIEIDNSRDLLMEILTYMYSCKLRTAEQNWRNPVYMTEMFQMIDRYGLHHLYKAFARNDWRQERFTANNVIRNETRFPLEDYFGIPFKSPSFMWSFETLDDYFLLKIDLYFETNNPCFSYSIQSKTKKNFILRVNLAFAREFPNSELVSPFHERECWFRTGEPLVSGTCYMEGCRNEVTLFKSRRDYTANGVPVLHFVRCATSLTDGSTAIQISNGFNAALQDHQHRIQIFGDHMWDLLHNRTEADLHVTCCRNPDRIRHLHKAIFAARVPDWRAVLEQVPGRSPDEMRCFLQSEAFDRVLEYIYTGKCHEFPSYVYEEVESFADRGGFKALRNLVNRLRAENTART